MFAVFLRYFLCLEKLERLALILGIVGSQVQKIQILTPNIGVVYRFEYLMLLHLVIAITLTPYNLACSNLGTENCGKALSGKFILVLNCKGSL